MPDLFYQNVLANMQSNKNIFHKNMTSENKELVDGMIIITGDFKKMVNDLVVKNLKMYPVKTFKCVSKLYHLTTDDLEDLCYDKFSKFESFLFFGCPYSTDIDCAVIVRSIDHENGQPYPLHHTEYERLIKEIKSISQLVGFTEDDIKNLDYNLIAIDPSEYKVVAFSKGGNEIQNMIMETYHYHEQVYPKPDLVHIDIEPFDKIRSIAKYIIDNLEEIISSDKLYKQIKDKRTIAYKEGIDEIIELSITILPYLNLEDRIATRNVYKSLTLKIAQLILLEHKEYEYTKLELANKVGKYLPELKDGILWNLFRGSFGVFNSITMVRLLEEYTRIINEYKSNIFTIYTSYNLEEMLDLHATFKMSKALYFEFLMSPTEPTNKFKIMWPDTYLSNQSINELFIIECSSQEDIHKLEYWIHIENFLWIDQRSEDWLTLLKYYTCGKNSKIVNDTIEAKYNLIRGAMAEQIILELFNPEHIGLKNYVKIKVGLIVEAFEHGSRGCAPDLLLLNVMTGELIIVEIKCLKTDKKNSDYYRELKMANKQCNETFSIIKKYDRTINVAQKLIIISWFDKSSALQLECFLDSFN
jgi:hypothetical protein